MLTENRQEGKRECGIKRGKGKKEKKGDRKNIRKRQKKRALKCGKWRKRDKNR